MVKQGDIIKLDFNLQVGYRLAVVLSNDFFYQKTNLVIVCPITNTDNRCPLHIPLDERTETTGVILCEHIKALDIETQTVQGHRGSAARSAAAAGGYCLFRN